MSHVDHGPKVSDVDQVNFDLIHDNVHVCVFTMCMSVCGYAVLAAEPCKLLVVSGSSLS